MFVSLQPELRFAGTWQPAEEYPFDFNFDNKFESLVKIVLLLVMPY